MKHAVVVLIFSLLLAASCTSPEKKGEHDAANFHEKSTSNPHIAKGFKVFQNGNNHIIEIYNPWDTTSPASIIHLVDDTYKNIEPGGETVLKVPVKSVVCMSASQLSYLQAIGEIEAVTGVANAAYFVSEDIKNLIKSGKVSEVGVGDQFKLEEMINLGPDVVLVSPQKGQDFQALTNAGLTVIPFGEYLESHPLGRAEWIKFMGLLTGKAELANQVFDSISNRYNNLKKLAAAAETRPTVISGKQYGGFWNLPGGNSYEARFLADAGAEYIWSNDVSTGGIMLDFETVYDRGLQADFWRFLVYSADEFGYEDLLREDARYADFGAFKEKKIIFCNSMKKPFYEKSLLEPHVILADYIHIFHPELLPGHQNVYYELMK